MLPFRKHLSRLFIDIASRLDDGNPKAKIHECEILRPEETPNLTLNQGMVELYNFWLSCRKKPFRLNFVSINKHKLVAQYEYENKIEIIGIDKVDGTDSIERVIDLNLPFIKDFCIIKCSKLNYVLKVHKSGLMCWVELQNQE